MEELLTRFFNILIADDHKLVAKLLQSYLANFFNMRLVGSVRTGKEVIESVKESDVDLILMDILMPEMNGIETAKEVHKLDPNIKIVFLSAMTNKHIISQAMKSGASGYLTKTASIEEIVEALQTVLKGEKYFSKECMQVFLGEGESNDFVPVDGSMIEMLTDREKEILKLVCQDMGAIEIAEKLYLSPRTVETHKKNIMTKLGVKSTVSLVRLVFERNLFKNELN